MRRTGAALLAGAALATCLSGCVSTQQKATWLHIQDARVISAQTAIVVHGENPAVRVQGIWLIHSGGRVAAVVRLRNLARHALTDLPISVGIQPRHGAPKYLNRSGNLDYFQSHVAVLGAGATVTWVLSTSARKLPAGRRFVRVGSRPVPALDLGHRLPVLRASVIRQQGDRLQLRLSNASGVPQPDLQLYAASSAGRSISAAGSASVAQLGAGQTVTTQVTLLGRTGGPVQIEALPTMFLP